MAIDKIFKSSNVDDLADNILSEVDDFMVSVDKMQQRKVAGNVQKVIQAFKQIETDLHDRYDNVTDVLEKRVSTIKDGRDGLNGTDGRNGRDGKPGRDGVNGKQGPPGTPGKDGTDGIDGVSVTDASIDFDGSLVISLSSGQQINVGEVVPPELERQLVELRQGGGSAGSSGDVMGPTASTDNAIVRFDGTTGKLVQNSVVTIADTTGNMAGVGSLAVGTTLGVTGVSTLTAGAVIQGLTVGLGAGAVATNTIVGNGALSTNSTGANLTAIGYQALFNSTGTRNSALGYRAGFNVNSGEYNTFIGGPEGSFGYSAGYSTTTGSFNTALGGGALANNLGASGNTACGYQSLLLNVAGVANVAIGQGALRATTSGNSAAVGYQAGLLATGIGNQFFGYSSGSAVTTGAKNVILGSYTGSAAPISATGSNYIVLSDGDGNVRQFFNGANATFNGTVSVTGAVTATGTDTGDVFLGLNSSASNRNDFVVRNASSNVVLGAVVGTTGILAGNSVIATVSSTGLAVTGNVLVTSTGGLGYGTGSGGAVTQATSRTTGVTLNKTNGAITLVSAAGLATFQSFTVTNSTVAATDVVSVVQKSGTDLYQIFVTAVAAGSFRISYATTGGTTTEQPVFNFAVIKAVTA